MAGRGFSDWKKPTVNVPLASVFDWSYQGSGSFTDSAEGVYSGITSTVIEGLGGKEIWIYSFNTTGWMVWTRGASNVHSFLGGVYFMCHIVDPDGNEIGGFPELQTPVLKENVDKIVVSIIFPLDRIADSTNPAYYNYLVGFSIAYEVRG